MNGSERRPASTAGPTSPADAAGFHDRLAPRWNQKYAKPSFAARLTILERSLEGAELAGSSWLDAGCGAGRLSLWLAERGAQVLGVDAAPQMIEEALRDAASAGLAARATFRVVERLEPDAWQRRRFDGVLCSSVLEYLDFPEAALDGFADALEPGGRLVVSVPDRWSAIRFAAKLAFRVGAAVGRPRPEWVRFSLHEYGRREFRAMLRSRGLEPRTVFRHGAPLPPPWQALPGVGGLQTFVAVKRAARSP